MFHRTRDNKYVNLAHVLHVAVEKAQIGSVGSRRFDVTFHLTTRRDPSAIGSSARTCGFPGAMIAAEPRVFCAGHHARSKGAGRRSSAHRSSAGRVMRRALFVPLCPYAMRIDYLTPILQPDGRVLTSDGTYAESEADWFASIQNPRILRRV